MANTVESVRSLHLLYHELRPVRSQYSYVVQNDMFATHLDLLAQIRHSPEPLIYPEITFDDGHISNFEYALPMLQARAVQARFFITVGWTGRKPGYMGWPELRALQNAGQAIGAHGWTHTLLTHCTNKDLQLELSGARQTLEDNLGVPITTMSLPGGRFNQRVIAACQDAGYSQIFTSIPQAESLPLGALVGRINVRGDTNLAWITSLLQPESKLLAGMERQYRRKAALKNLLGDQLYAQLWKFLNRAEPGSTDSKATIYEDPARHQ